MLTLEAHNSPTPLSLSVGGIWHFAEHGCMSSAFLSWAPFAIMLINLIPWLISPQNNVCLHKSIPHGKIANA